jgi:hypothetical protein
MSKEEYLKLLEIFVKIVEANKGLPVGEDDRMLDAEGLALKFLGHASSAIYLYRSTTISEINFSFFDAGSINVLGRATLETFLVFHYVFVEPKSDEERDFRYYSWLIAGLLESQKYPIQSTKGKMLLLKENKLIEPLRIKLANNPYFLKLTEKQQGKLIQQGVWKLHKWKDIALSAGLNGAYAKTFYNYLCGYAHAGNLSVLELRQVWTSESQKALCAATISVLMITIANMIKSYSSVFPRSQSILQQDKDASRLIDIYVGIGSASIEEIELDWVSEI